MSFVVAHLLSLIGFVMAILLVARAGEQRRPTGSLVAWLFAILLVPYIGVPLYLVFGGRKLARRVASKAKLERSRDAGVMGLGRLAAMLCRSGAAAPTGGNALTLLATGEVAFAEISRVVSSARSVIHISTLIFADDEVGRALAELLIQRSRAGVEVRVLVDALFKFRSSRRLIGELRAAGVKLAWFMPLFSPWQRRRINLRLHRKVVLVDGELAIVGGMNLAREYMGPVPWPGRWRDLSLLVTGPAVRDIVSIFVSDWRFASGELIPELPALAAPAAATQAAAPPAATNPAQHLATVQVTGSGPDAESDRIYDALLSGIFDARRRLWISTPYFVPDEPLLRALILAVRRGVDVRVVVPRRSNHLTADWAGGSSLRELAREGGIVRCYAPAMLHAKLVLIDEEIAILGSANIDMRSLFLNYEIALVLTSAAAAAELDAWFMDLFAECVDLEPAGRARSILEPVARLLAPLE
jgi:cardiolipin synthase A/B